MAGQFYYEYTRNVQLLTSALVCFWPSLPLKALKLKREECTGRFYGAVFSGEYGILVPYPRMMSVTHPTHGFKIRSSNST